MSIEAGQKWVARANSARSGIIEVVSFVDYVVAFKMEGNSPTGHLGLDTFIGDYYLIPAEAEAIFNLRIERLESQLKVSNKNGDAIGAELMAELFGEVDGLKANNQALVDKLNVERARAERAENGNRELVDLLNTDGTRAGQAEGQRELLRERVGQLQTQLVDAQDTLKATRADHDALTEELARTREQLTERRKRAKQYEKRWRETLRALVSLASERSASLDILHELRAGLLGVEGS